MLAAPLLLVALAPGAPVELSPAPGGGLRFSLPSTAGEVHGAVDVFSAWLDPEAGTASLTAEAATISSANGPRDQRILVFALEVARFATIRFNVSRLEGTMDALRAGEGTGALRLHGRLAIRDVERDEVVNATFAWAGGALRLQGAHDVPWAAFGVPDPSVLLAQVGPTARVAFDLQGKRP